MPELCLKDGAILHYSDLGQGRPIMMVHGFGMTGECFWPQIDLSKIGRLIIPDLRGCGKSSIGEKPLTIDTLGDDIFELIENLGLKDIIWIGWSMGAIILWNAFGRHDLSAVSKMIAIDMTAKIANEKDWQLGIKGLLSETTAIGAARANKVTTQMRDDWATSVPKMVSRILASGSSNTPASQEIERKLITIAKMNKGANAAALWRGLLDCDVRSKIVNFNIDTTIIQGEKSQLYLPKVCEYMARALPDADLICFENSGHAPHLEEAQRFNSIVADNLTQRKTLEDFASKISI